MRPLGNPLETSYKLSTFILSTVLFSTFLTEIQGIHCHECDSAQYDYCPEFMSSDDAGIVPYKNCSHLSEARYCVKYTGVTGGSEAIKCYRCDETKDADLGCTDALFSAPLKDCDDIFDAYYCVKITGLSGGILGTRRSCSSRDIGNYCDYIKRPGDQLEYRSCVFTCSSDGCNGAESGNGLRPFSQLFIFLSTSVLIFAWLL